jgi:hypothetical protein
VARGFSLRLNYFVCVTSSSRICCAAKRRALHQTEAAFLLLVVVGDSACGTSVLTSFNRAPPVALSGMVADSHMNEL